MFLLFTFIADNFYVLSIFLFLSWYTVFNQSEKVFYRVYFINTANSLVSDHPYIEQEKVVAYETWSFTEKM